MDHPRSISGGGEDNVTIPDDLRCKRSDGKQWRCTAMSMPDKTVCEKHYIQAKKRAANSAMRASIKKAKRKSVGESDIYLESKSDDMDLPLSSQFGDYSGSSGKKKKEKLSKAQASYSPEMPAVRSHSGRSSLRSNDDLDLDRDGSDYEDSRRSYRTPPTSTVDSDRSRPQKMFETSPMTMAVSQSRNAGLPLINILRLKGVPILQQLHLEERLLRTSSGNWCIINDGTTRPTIVMGVSGKPKELLETDAVLRDEIPVVRRFSGGGTVIVDQGTIFVTFICNKDAIPSIQPYPQPIMSWSSLIYKNIFQGIGDFGLRENDYVLGNRKFGGNAQSITKNRWVHHTSFLWDYEVSSMGYLKMPKRVPEYRQARDHLEFICRMKDYMSRSNFIDGTMNAMGSHFVLVSPDAEDIKDPSASQFVPSSKLLTREELGEASYEFQRATV